MTRMKCFIAMMGLCLAAACAAAPGWRDMHGRPVPESGTHRSSQGFSAMLVVTPDKDWRTKWNTPADEVPKFSEAREVMVGGELAILIFFANPKPDGSGTAHVACDLQVVRPDGSFSANEKDVECYTGPIAGHEAYVQLSRTTLRFVAEATDLPGKWLVRVVVKDNVRGVPIALDTAFTLRGQQAHRN